MKPSSSFQVIVISIAIIFLVAGVVTFALFGGAFGNSGQGPVVIWGTLDAQTMQSVVNSLKVSDNSFNNVTYVQKEPALYENGIINAIAAGTPPDIFLLPQANIAQFADKIQPISYNSVSQTTFTNSFVDEGQLFLTPSGALALPFTIDPLVMYWNRDIFASAGVSLPPALWKDLINNAPHLTQLDASKNITRSAVALGLWSNVTNAKAIFSTLVMQAGDPIVIEKNGIPISVFGTNPNNSTGVPAESALRFYTDFANPSKSVYSWSRALPSAKDAFAAGNTAVYFGFASEFGALQARNPNLHFGVAVMPQAQGATTDITYGSITGLAIPRGAKNPSGALAMAQKLTAAPAITFVAKSFNEPPVRRDLIQNVPSDAVQQTFMKSALISRAWFDPNPPATDAAFQTMVESVVSGAVATSDATSAGAQAFARLLPRQ